MRDRSSLPHVDLSALDRHPRGLLRPRPHELARQRANDDFERAKDLYAESLAAIGIAEALSGKAAENLDGLIDLIRDSGIVMRNAALAIADGREDEAMSNLIESVLALERLQEVGPLWSKKN